MGIAAACFAVTGCPKSNGSGSSSGGGASVARDVPLVDFPAGCDEAIVQALKGATKTMNVTAYASRGIPRLEPAVDRLRGQLAHVQKVAGDRFTYRVVEMATPADANAARAAGCVAAAYDVAADGDVHSEDGFMCVAFDYAGTRDVIKLLSAQRIDDDAFWFTAKFRALRGKADGTRRKVGMLTSRGAIKLTETNLVPVSVGKVSVAKIFAQQFDAIDLVEVDLKNGDGEIDGALDGLIVTQPSSDLNEKELQRIDAFVMKGKSLAVFASAVNVKGNDPLFAPTLGAHGLERLLAGYGIEMQNNAIIDYGRGVRLHMEPAAKGERGRSAHFPEMVEIAPDVRFSGNAQLLDTTFAPFARIPKVTAPFASALVLHPEKQPGAKVQAVLRTTPIAEAQTGKLDFAPTRTWKAPDAPQQFVVGASAVGKLTSAFGPGASAKEARVFVLASSQFFANPFVRATDGRGPDSKNPDELVTLGSLYSTSVLTNTLLVLKNTVDWMSGDDAAAQCALPVAGSGNQIDENSAPP